MTLTSRKHWKTSKRCCDKETFDTEAEALAALDRKKRISFGPPPPSGVYRCKRGHKYHLTDRTDPTQNGLTEWERVKAGVVARDKQCIRCGAVGKLDVHHRRLQSQGGRDEPQNLVTVCRKCHDFVHDHPFEATKAGLIVRRGADPLKVPVEHRAWGEPVHLTSDYQYGAGTP